MKTDIHPTNYRLVVFEDINNGQTFLIKSTAVTKEKIKYTDGQTYPLVRLHITSASHPFYTGLEKLVDIEGRIDKFKTRQDAAVSGRQQLQARSAKNLKRGQKPPTPPVTAAKLKQSLNLPNVAKAKPKTKKSSTKAKPNKQATEQPTKEKEK